MAAQNNGSRQFTYDRWGNRTIRHRRNTYGTGINNKAFDSNTQLTIVLAVPWQASQA